MQVIVILLFAGAQRPGRDPTGTTAAGPTSGRQGSRLAAATPGRLSGDPVIAVKRKERRPDERGQTVPGINGRPRSRRPISASCYVAMAATGGLRVGAGHKPR